MVNYILQGFNKEIEKIAGMPKLINNAIARTLKPAIPNIKGVSQSVNNRWFSTTPTGMMRR